MAPVTARATPPHVSGVSEARTSQTVKTAQIKALTGMRGFAALMVVLVHVTALSPYHRVGLHGYGPIALFVLSGFLLHRPFGRWTLGLAPRPDLRAFVVRRALRIFPAYWVVLHLWYLIWPSAAPRSPAEYLRDLTLVGSLQHSSLVPGLNQVWSMGVELCWYVALPLLGVGLHLALARLPVERRLRPYVLSLVATAPFSALYVLWAGLVSGHDSAAMWMPKFLVCFALGALFSVALDAERAGLASVDRQRAWFAGWRAPTLALAAALVIVSPLSGDKTMTGTTLLDACVRDVAALTLVVSVLAMATLPPPSSLPVRLLSTRGMQAVGRWSYGIFLWHMPVLMIIQTEIALPQGVSAVVGGGLLVLAVSSVLGAASWAWVEAPAMALSKEFTGSGGPSRRQRRGEHPVDPWVGAAPETAEGRP